MSSKTLDQLIREMDTKVAQEDFEKKASAADNLTDLWMQALGTQTEPKEEEDMYEFTKQAAQEDALNTMCIYYAADVCSDGMSKQASVMNKQAAQEMVINHCYHASRGYVTPEVCIMKEASDRTMSAIGGMTAAGTEKFWAGFMKAAAEDASATAGSADGASGAAPNSVSTDYAGYKAQAPNMDLATGSTMPIDGSGTIESMIAKVMGGSGSSYGYQGVLSHDFLPKA